MEFINSPVHVIRYKQYLKSLDVIWPKIFDKVGVWAYCYYGIPWEATGKVGPYKRRKENPFNYRLSFEAVQIEKHIREDIY